MREHRDLIAMAVAGFLSGVMLTALLMIGVAERIASEKLNSEAIFKAYNLGKRDALSLRPASWDLEMSCASLWASKLPHKPENH